MGEYFAQTVQSGALLLASPRPPTRPTGPLRCQTQRNHTPCPRSGGRALLLCHCQMARTLTGHGSSDSRLEDAATLTNRHPTRWRDGNRSGPIAQQLTKRRKEDDGSR